MFDGGKFVNLTHHQRFAKLKPSKLAVKRLLVLIWTLTHVPQSFYLTFKAINMSSQKPCILHAHFTQAHWTLDTLYSIINSWYHFSVITHWGSIV